MASPDILIVGLGPAGLALAAACTRRGLDVQAADAHAGRAWSATYGMWEQQWERACAAFPALASVPVAVTSTPQLIAPRRGGRPARSGDIDADYVVVDSPALQRALSKDLPPGMTSDVALTTGELRARAAQGTRVVDCRGAVPPELRRAQGTTVDQTAFGVILPTALAARYLPGGRGCLMDWRTDALGLVAGERPSFLYAVCLPGDRMLLEETDLVGAPALSAAVLRRRLHRRLGWVDAHGEHDGGDLDAVEGARGVLATERVHFPVVPAPRPHGIECFGTAGSAGHPATGYSVAESLRTATAAAEALADGGPLPGFTNVGTTTLHRIGLRALLGIDGPALQEMFAGFAGMEVRRQIAFFERSSGAFPTAVAMATQWWATTNATRAEVARVALIGR